MTASAETVERSVRLEDLQVGTLLAEGGEGRVYELPRRPHLVLKRYRRPTPREFVDDLVTWPDLVGDPNLISRVQTATAWPVATVIGPALPPSGRASSGRAPSLSGVEAPSLSGAGGPSLSGAGAPSLSGAGAPSLFGAGAPSLSGGVLIPRAPRRFSLRHRDGTTRLATLSYLTADPVHRAVAYGLSLPDPVSPQRLGLVYALARVLEAFESASPAVSHGDLSTKNVLWSLQRGPEVFVIDCDNCERFDPDGRPLTRAARRRAMTPNWDDPAVSAGANPTLASDRYSLALIFLRVVGAANFPIQARQRQGKPVAVDFAVPPAHYGETLLGPGAPLWDLCERGLSVSEPERRPTPSAWVAALEAVLDTLGAAAVMRSVWASQGGGSPSSGSISSPGSMAGRLEAGRNGASGRDVIIRPVVASARQLPRWTLVPPDAPAAPWRRPSAPLVGLAGTGSGVGTGVGPGGLVSAGAAATGGVATGGVATGGVATGGVATGGVATGGVAGGPAGGRSIWAEAWGFLAGAVVWWVGWHRQTVGVLWASGDRRDGLRRLAICVLLDLGVLLVGLFVVAMIVSPVLGI